MIFFLRPSDIAFQKNHLVGVNYPYEGNVIIN